MAKNLFLNQLTRKDTTTENGALSNSSTGSEILDYFTKAATYRGREQSAVDSDMISIWGDNPELAMRCILYLRMITRVNKGFVPTEKVQKGQGLRDEPFKALLWVAHNHPNVFYKNLWLIPEIGSWKDLFTIWFMDNRKAVKLKPIYELMLTGLGIAAGLDELEDLEDMGEAENCHRENILKMGMPTIRKAKDCTTDRAKARRQFAKGFAEFLGKSDRGYRKFKSAGKSHEFQRLMCQRAYALIEFNKIAGRALNQLVTRRGKDGQTFIERHKLTNRYAKWIAKQPVAKFKGYVYELMESAKHGGTLVEKMTINKQFDGLIELAKKDGGGIKGNVWCALDTSGSMSSRVVGDVSAYDICISLGVYFSALNEGAFKDNVIMFDSVSRKLKLKGTFCDKVKQIREMKTAWGSTNFQSVIDEIVRIRRQNPSIPVSDFPETLLVVTDGQFNPVGGNTQTNYEAAMRKLAAVGLPNITIVWWFVTGRGGDFPSNVDDKGVMLIGGFDGSVMTLLLGGDEVVDRETGEKRKPTPMEAMTIALNQEILQSVRMK